MVERLPSLPEMQVTIDALMKAYGETAIATYNTDGTTCLILTDEPEASSYVYVTVVQIDVATLEVTTREISTMREDITSVLI